MRGFLILGVVLALQACGASGSGRSADASSGDYDEPVSIEGVVFVKNGLNPDCQFDVLHAHAATNDIWPDRCKPGMCVPMVDGPVPEARCNSVDDCPDYGACSSQEECNAEHTCSGLPD